MQLSTYDYGASLYHRVQPSRQFGTPLLFGPLPRNFATTSKRSRKQKEDSKHSAAWNSEGGSTFQSRALGQKKIKEIMKHVHPDLFATAPDDVRQTNAASLQELNENLQALKVFTD